MKKIKCFSLAILFLCMGILNNGCFGTFKLTQNLYNWNNSIGDKWVNTLVFWAFIIIPVYEVVTFIDAVILNVIEFWSGSNPIAMSEGEEEIQYVESGNKEYMIRATKNRFHIEQVSGRDKGEWADIVFVPEENSCYLHYKGEKIKLVEYIHSDVGADQVKLFLPGENVISMDANTRNLDVIQAALKSGTHFMADRN